MALFWDGVLKIKGNCIFCQLFYGCESQSRRHVQELPSDPPATVI
jgi:hypothetical protein